MHRRRRDDLSPFPGGMTLVTVPDQARACLAMCDMRADEVSAMLAARAHMKPGNILNDDITSKTTRAHNHAERLSRIVPLNAGDDALLAELLELAAATLNRITQETQHVLAEAQRRLDAKPPASRAKRRSRAGASRPGVADPTAPQPHAALCSG